MSQHNISVGDIIGYKTIFSAPNIIYARVGTLMEVKDSIYTDTKTGEIILELEPVDPMEKMKIKPEVVRLKSIEIVTLYKEHIFWSSTNK